MAFLPGNDHRPPGTVDRDRAIHAGVPAGVAAPNILDNILGICYSVEVGGYYAANIVIY
jgi:hypothetical protein